MPRVFIPTQLTKLTGGAREVAVEGHTVAQLLDELESRFPGVRSRLCEDDQLVAGWQVSIDHVMTSRGLAAKVSADSEVHFLPAIGGG